jgi:hypothetical protein
MNSYDATWDTEVLRNVTIQRTAEGLKEIDGLYKAKRYQEAWQLANGLEKDLREVARLSNDAQLVQDADLMRKYQDTLAKWVQNQTGKAPQSSDLGDTGLNRGRLPTTNGAPTIEIK